MANQNFVVHNGLTVGPLTIFASNGTIVTTGNVSTDAFPIVLDDIVVDASVAAKKGQFRLKLNGVAINNTRNIVDSRDLEVFVNGIRQRPYVQDVSPTLPWLEYSVVNQSKTFRYYNSGQFAGNLFFYNIPVKGATISSTVRSSSVSKQTRGNTKIYSGLTIALGD